MFSVVDLLIDLFLFQSMTLKEAIKSSLTILKQVMEEKLNAINIEVKKKKKTTRDDTRLEREGTFTLHLMIFYTANLIRYRFSSSSSFDPLRRTA